MKLFQRSSLCNRLWPYKTTVQLQMFCNKLHFIFTTAKLFHLKRFAIILYGYTHTYACTCIHTIHTDQTCTQTQTHMCTLSHTHTHKHTHTNIHTYLAKYIHTYIHTDTHRHTQTHTHTQTHRDNHQRTGVVIIFDSL